MKTAESWCETVDWRRLSREAPRFIIGDLIRAAQADALESAAVNAETVEHYCSHTSCSGGGEVAANIRRLKP